MDRNTHTYIPTYLPTYIHSFIHSFFFGFFFKTRRRKQRIYSIFVSMLLNTFLKPYFCNRADFNQGCHQTQFFVFFDSWVCWKAGFFTKNAEHCQNVFKIPKSIFTSIFVFFFHVFVRCSCLSRSSNSIFWSCLLVFSCRKSGTLSGHCETHPVRWVFKTGHPYGTPLCSQQTYCFV